MLVSVRLCRPPLLLPLALLQVVSTKNATDDEGDANRVLGGATGGQPEGAAALRAPGVLQAWSSSSSRSAAAGGGWSWRAWEPEPLNLLGTLRPTPSADLAGCCSNPNASAGEYDTKAAYALQASTCPTTRRPPPPPGPRGGAYARRCRKGSDSILRPACSSCNALRLDTNRPPCARTGWIA